MSTVDFTDLLFKYFVNERIFSSIINDKEFFLKTNIIIFLLNNIDIQLLHLKKYFYQIL